MVSMINVRKYVMFAWLGVSTPVVVIVNALAALLPMSIRRKAAYGMAQFWSIGMLTVTGSRVTKEGLHHITHDGPYVIMCNHRSHMDTPVLLRCLPFLFGFIVKKELMQIPVFSAGMKTIGCVAVSRGRDRADYSVLDAVAEDVSRGKNILIFPEGTRAPDDEFLPFKKGGVVLAIKAGVPILPVAVSGTGRVIPARVMKVFQGDLLLRVGEPIPTDQLTLEDRDALLAEVRARISEMYVPGYGAKPAR